MSRIMRTGLAVGIAATVLASVANGQVRRPSGSHAFFNFIPFGGSGQVCTQHQVFDSTLWSGPMEISALGFSANNSLNGQQYVSDVVLKMGYTDKVPGQSPPTGLDSILSNNPSSAMTEVYNARVDTILVGTGSEDFSFILRFDTPFCYDPARGNLLVEIFSSYISGADLSVSRTAGSAESSRAYNSTRFGDAASPTTATRMDFYEDRCSGGGLDLTLRGTCPGTITVAWDGATPNSRMGILFASNTGSFVVPGGPCAGTQLGLGSSNLRLVNTVNTGGGSGSVNGQAGSGACRGFLQLIVVDNSPCTTSDVEQIQ